MVFRDRQRYLAAPEVRRRALYTLDLLKIMSRRAAIGNDNPRLPTCFSKANLVSAVRFSRDHIARLRYMTGQWRTRNVAQYKSFNGRKFDGTDAPLDSDI